MDVSAGRLGELPKVEVEVDYFDRGEADATKWKKKGETHRGRTAG
jgi:hypothetical protein